MSLRALVAMLFCFPGIVFSQEDTCVFEIIGTVLDIKTEKPLPYVSIQLEDSLLGTVTDDQGYFYFELACREEYDLVFSSVGYKSVVHHHDFHHGEMVVYMSPSSYLLNSVVVEGEHSHAGSKTQATDVLGAERLSIIPSNSLGEALSEISGVDMLQTGQNIIKPIIHGLHSNRVVIINNGLRHEFQNWGESHAPEIEIGLADRVEVVKGAAGVRYGADALAGVVLVSPKDPDLLSPLDGEVSLGARSNGRVGRGKLFVSKGYGHFAFSGGIAYYKQGDLRAPNYLLTNTGREELSWTLSARWHIRSDMDLYLRSSAITQELGVLRGSIFSSLEDITSAIGATQPLVVGDKFSYDIGSPRHENSHDLHTISWRLLRNTHSLEVTYGYQENHRQEYTVRRTEAPIIDLDLNTHSLETKWLHPALGRWEGSVGVQLQKKKNSNNPGTNTVPFIPNYEQVSLGAYLIESWSWEGGLVEMGVRADYQELDVIGREPNNTIYQNKVVYRNLSGTLGLQHRLSEHWSMKTNVGTAWRAPNVSELYRFGQRGYSLEYGLWRYTIDEASDFISTRQGILDEEDRNVPSEVGWKWVGDLQYSGHATNFKILTYVNWIENFIYSRPAGITRTTRGFFPFYIYDQTDAIFLGVDAEMDVVHGPEVKSEASASILWSRQVGGASSYFALQPAPEVKYRLDWTPSIREGVVASLSAKVSYTFHQPWSPRVLSVDDFLNAAQLGLDRFGEDAEDFDLLPPPPGFFLAGLEASMAAGVWEATIVLDNLLNQSYRRNTDHLRYFADDLGFNFSFSLRYNL